MKLKTLLWLDDMRNPFEQNGRWAILWSPIPMPFETHWVKSYVEFVDWITANGLPDAICFDHDLSEEHYNLGWETDDLTWEEYYAKRDREETGYDCAKWLIAYCHEHSQPIPPFKVQSMNAVGKDNIIKLLTKYNNET